MKIPPEIGISLCRLTFSHQPFTKSGIRILPANSVISEVIICTELKSQKLSEHAMVKGHTWFHKLARNATSNTFTYDQLKPRIWWNFPCDASGHTGGASS